MVEVGWRFVQGGLSSNRGMWRKVFCARRFRALPVIPRIGVKGHQAGELRGFHSPGSAWDGRQTREDFFSAELTVRASLCQ
jgi:hypothetical protein